MWSGRRKSAEQNKINYYNNQISQIFKPVNGVIPEVLEELTWLFNGNNMYNVNSGFVGIGTKTPLRRLDVSGTINSSSAITVNYLPIAPPVGSIIAYISQTVSPSGWLKCDGSAVSRVMYASLFAVISDAFGVGDGSTTFNLPDYRGAFLRGTGTNGVYSGPSINTSQNHATQTHNHGATSTVTDLGHVHSQTSLNDDFNDSGGIIYPANSNPSFAKSDSAGTKTWSNVNSNTTGITVATTVANSTTSVNANETRPYNFGVYWIIKF